MLEATPHIYTYIYELCKARKWRNQFRLIDSNLNIKTGSRYGKSAWTVLLRPGITRMMWSFK